MSYGPAADGGMVGEVFDLHGCHVYTECQFLHHGGMSEGKMNWDFGYEPPHPDVMDSLMGNRPMSGEAGGSEWDKASFVLLGFINEGSTRMPVIMGQLLSLKQRVLMAATFADDQTANRGSGSLLGGRVSGRDLVRQAGGTLFQISYQGGVTFDTNWLSKSDMLADSVSKGLADASEQNARPGTGSSRVSTSSDGVSREWLPKTPYIRFICTHTEEGLRGEVSVILQRWSWKKAKAGGGWGTEYPSEERKNAILKRDFPMLGQRVSTLMYAAFKHFEQRIFQLETQMLWCWNQFITVEKEFGKLDGAVVLGTGSFNGTLKTPLATVAGGPVTTPHSYYWGSKGLFEHSDQNSTKTGKHYISGAAGNQRDGWGSRIPYGVPTTPEHVKAYDANHSKNSSSQEEAAMASTVKMTEKNTAKSANFVSELNEQRENCARPPSYGERVRGLVRWYQGGYNSAWVNWPGRSSLTIKNPTWEKDISAFSNIKNMNPVSGAGAGSGRLHPVTSVANSPYNETSTNIQKALPASIEFHFPCDAKIATPFFKKQDVGYGHYALNSPEQNAPMIAAMTFSETAMNLFTAGIHVSGMSVDEDSPSFGFETVMNKKEESVTQDLRKFFHES